MEGRRYTIKQLPPELRPRERLLSEGPEALSSAELLGILFGAGTKESTAVELAGQVISESGDLFGLYGVSVHDLLGLHGIGEAKACTILAAVEFGKRLGRVRNPERPVISSPADVDGLLRGRIASLDRENFVAVLLNTKNEVIGFPTISVGTLSASLVHPREVFKPAIRASGRALYSPTTTPAARSDLVARTVRSPGGSPRPPRL